MGIEIKSDINVYRVDKFMKMFKEACGLSKQSVQLFYDSVELYNEAKKLLKQMDEKQKQLDETTLRLAYLRNLFENDMEYVLREFVSDDMEEEKVEKPCYVYYMLNEYGSKVKIGISYDPERRAKEIATSSGDEIKILNTIRFDSRKEAESAEISLHRTFSYCRRRPAKVAGREWFDHSIIEILKKNFWDKESINKNL